MPGCLLFPLTKRVQVVLVSTSAGELNGHATGLWMEEMAAPYYAFLNMGYEVTVASPAGGPIPLDAASLTADFFTDAAKKFLHDATAVGQLSHSKKLADFDVLSQDAMYMTGGHGTCNDFVQNDVLKSKIEAMWKANKIVAAVCHGPVCLADVMEADGTTPLVKGKRVTGFSDSEEEAVQLTQFVPFSMEQRFKEQGALYEKAADDWNSKVCVDGLLVTGQNPQSSEECAEAVIKLLEG